VPRPADGFVQGEVYSGVGPAPGPPGLAGTAEPPQPAAATAVPAITRESTSANARRSRVSVSLGTRKFDQIQRRLRRLAPEARRAKSTTPTPERHKAFLAAVAALNAGETPAEQATLQVALELSAHEPRQPNRKGVVFDRP